MKIIILKFMFCIIVCNGFAQSKQDSLIEILSSNNLKIYFQNEFSNNKCYYRFFLSQFKYEIAFISLIYKNNEQLTYKNIYEGSKYIKNDLYYLYGFYIDKNKYDLYPNQNLTGILLFSESFEVIPIMIDW